MLDWLPFGDSFITGWVISIIRAVWQGGIVFVLIWLILLIFPRIQPTIRCWLWRIAYLRLLVSFLADPLPIPWLFSTKISTSPVVRLLDTGPVGQWITISQPVPGLHPVNLPVYSDSRFWFLLWILGIGWSGIQLIVLWKRNRMAAENCYPAYDPVLANLYQEFCGRLKIRKPPRLYQSNSLGSPSLSGITQSKIILPVAVCSQYEPEEINLMIAHELAHYRRGDLFWNWLPVIVRSLFFFYPLVWLAERQWKELPEICSDHLALQYTGTRSVDYGKVLVKTTLQLALKRKNRWVLAGVTDFYRPGSNQTLIKRLKALDSNHRIHPKWVFISFFALVLLGLAVVLPWQLSPGIKFFANRVSCTNYYKFNFFAHLQADQLYIQDFIVQFDDQKVTEGISIYSYGEIKLNTLNGYLLVKNSLIPKGSHRIKVFIRTNAGNFREKYLVDFNSDNLWCNYSVYQSPILNPDSASLYLAKF
jgi:beta-lactamase regulating signal transducer with metallopeptidase domain